MDKKSAKNSSITGVDETIIDTIYKEISNIFSA